MANDKKTDPAIPQLESLDDTDKRATVAQILRELAIQVQDPSRCPKFGRAVDVDGGVFILTLATPVLETDKAVLDDNGSVRSKGKSEGGTAADKTS